MAETADIATDAAAIEPASVPLWAFYAYFLRLGATGFGGPIALAGFMQRDLVDERQWISRQDYLDGLALAQLAPGPARGATGDVPRLRSRWHRRRDHRRRCVSSCHPS